MHAKDHCTVIVFLQSGSVFDDSITHALCVHPTALSVVHVFVTGMQPASVDLQAYTGHALVNEPINPNYLELPWYTVSNACTMSGNA